MHVVDSGMETEEGESYERDQVFFVCLTTFFGTGTNAWPHGLRWSCGQNSSTWADRPGTRVGHFPIEVWGISRYIEMQKEIWTIHILMRIDAFSRLSNCEAGDNWGVSCFDWIELFCQVHSVLFNAICPAEWWAISSLSVRSIGLGLTLQNELVNAREAFLCRVVQPF